MNIQTSIQIMLPQRTAVEKSFKCKQKTLKLQDEMFALVHQQMRETELFISNIA